MVLQENMRSKNPAWKVMGIDEVKERQKRRAEYQQKKESKLQDKTSNELLSEQLGVYKENNKRSP